MTTPPLPEQIEPHRDRMWRREEELRVESALDAERFIEDVGFANTLTDARRVDEPINLPEDTEDVVHVEPVTDDLLSRRQKAG